MGIKGLSSFMTQNTGISPSFKLHDTKVIFDGSNLIHSLYYNNKLDFIYGGEYKRYYDCVRMYISSFLECNVTPLMIFDGGQEKTARKLKYSIKKAEGALEHIRDIARGKDCSDVVFPLLAYEVFYAVLFDLGVQFANCDYSADSQVASLGNYYDCPVISNDSDFYVFDAHKGFIQLDSIDTKINSERDSDGNKYKFLYCKIYYIDEFVKNFPGLDKNILPLFGTLFGKEFVESHTFDIFLKKFKLPRYKSGPLTFNLGRMKERKFVGLLCWLQHKSLNEAVNLITSYFPRNDRENIKSIIDNSVCGYKLNPCNLTYIFDKNVNDPQIDLLVDSMLVTPCGSKLPEHFVLKFHQGHLPSFLINIIGVHRVFLQPQIEDMELKSSYSCSSYIRQILYGIIVRHDINGTECRNKACLGVIEEYDRQGYDIHKKEVKPLFSVDGIGTLPKINEVHSVSKDQCIVIMTKTLGLSSEYLNSIPDAWQLYIGSINFWLRISEYRSVDFISAVILNLIYFDLIKCKTSFLNQKPCPKKMPTSDKCGCSTIICRAANVSESDLHNAEKMLEEYFLNPTLNRNNQNFLNIVHRFNQIQSCLLHITFLNQVLNDCFQNPAPQKYFSGTMLYSLTEAIASQSSAEEFIRNILGKDLNVLFIDLKSKVCENIPNLNVSRTTVGYSIRKGKKRSHSDSE